MNLTPEFYAAVCFSCISFIFAVGYLIKISLESNLHRSLSFSNLNTLLKYKIVLYGLFSIEQPIVIWFYCIYTLFPSKTTQLKVIFIVYIAILWSKFVLMIFATIFRFKYLMKVKQGSKLGSFLILAKCYTIFAYLSVMTINIYDTVYISDIYLQKIIALTYICVGGVIGIIDSFLNFLMTIRVLSTQLAKDIENDPVKTKIINAIKFQVVCFYIFSVSAAGVSSYFYYDATGVNQYVRLIAFNFLSINTLFTMKILDLIKLAISTVKNHTTKDTRRVTQLSSVHMDPGMENGTPSVLVLESGAPSVVLLDFRSVN